ncbi:acyltransferase [Oxalobacteraceae bacterium OM1]|nr:acyltransferase [Oxalobacteraceae bacterium OM1]
MFNSIDTIRLRGLDTLRAAAIALVLMSHYASFVSGEHTFGFLDKIGSSGVDLFFVLSGYLIGNQILAPIGRGEDFRLKTFFARRLLRTLPSYYVVLTVYLLFPHSSISGSSTPPLWQLLTFTQNFGLAYGQTFTHSWSLCIEEQFYVVLPLVVLALARWKRSVHLAWGVLGAAIVFGMAARALAYMQYGHGAFAANVYYSSFCRFDGLLPGVAIAMICNFHPAVFARLQRYANVLLVTGLGAASLVLYGLHNDLPNTFVSTTFGFSLVAVSYAVLTCAALSPGCVLNRIRIPGASKLALWSYAVYLAHKPVFMMLHPQLERLHINAGAPMTVIAVMASGIFVGWLLFQLVETPFMRLRARLYPASSAHRSPVTASTVLEHEAVGAGSNGLRSILR